MNTIIVPGKRFISVLCFMLFLQFVIFQSCKKIVDTPASEEIAGKRKPNPHDPPPPPPQLTLGCGSQTIQGTFNVGQPANVTITFNYYNSPGGSYPEWSSSTVNGITLSTSAGVLNNGSGTIVYTASGTPINAGYLMLTVYIPGTNIGCAFVVAVLNPILTGGNCSDPGPTEGSTGCVTFTYRGQQVTYATVRAADGRIWLQQNLGSPQVSMHETDVASYGDYFQWGRWDDGHQVKNGPTVTGGLSLQNPSHIPSGNPNFIIGSTASTKWWGIGGLATDTWSGTEASSTNGKDPCVALGPGWRLPTAAEWNTVSFAEDLFGTIGAQMSNLKLPSPGIRYSDGGYVFSNSDIGYYWTSTAADNSQARVFFFDNLYNAGVVTSSRGEGYPCRCLKD